MPAEDRPLVVVLAHCPPEQLLFGFPYHAVPVEGWEFAFCDALGLADTQTQQAGGPAPEQPAVAASDPRRWIAVGFGLIRQPKPEAARAEFLPLFLESLRAAARAAKTAVVGMTPQRLGARGVRAAARVYAAAGVSDAQRAEAAVAIFTARPYLRDALLESFVAAWGATLERTVRSAATALLGASAVTGGVLELVRANLRWLLGDFLRATYAGLAAEFGLEALALLPLPPADAEGGAGASPDPEADALRRFAAVGLRALAALAPTDVAHTQGAPRFPVQSTAPRAATLPLFAQLSKPMRGLVKRAVDAATAAGDASPAGVLRAAAAALEDEPVLAPLMASIE